MEYITNEYTTLIKDGDEIIIKPNVPFNGIPEGYKITAYATIKNQEGAVVSILKPGELTVELKGAPILSQLSIRDLKELAISKGRSFPSRATSAKLIEILEA